jgi:ATP-dependent Clp protease adapter protein ClpS
MQGIRIFSHYTRSEYALNLLNEIFGMQKALAEEEIMITEHKYMC